MSAYTVEKDPIDLIVSAIVSLMNDEHRLFVDTDRMGTHLWDENYDSVNYKYRAHDEHEPYVWVPVPELFATDTVPVPTALWVQVDVTISNYIYQSCEHPQWRDSAACILVEATQNLIRTEKLIGWPKEDQVMQGGEWQYTGHNAALWNWTREEGFAAVLEATQHVEVQ